MREWVATSRRLFLGLRDNAPLQRDYTADWRVARFCCPSGQIDTVPHHSLIEGRVGGWHGFVAFLQQTRTVFCFANLLFLAQTEGLDLRSESGGPEAE